MKLILIFISYCSYLLCTAVAEKQVECNKSLEKRMDQIMAKITTVGNTGRKFPENEEQAPHYCNETLTMLKTVKDYAKNCLKNLAKQVTSMLVYIIESKVKTMICKKNSKQRAELLDAAVCGNKGSKQFQKCMSNFIDSVLGAQNIDDKLKIPHVCCQYQDIKGCIDVQGKRVSYCTEKRLESINQYVDSIAGEFIPLLCSDYESGSDKCAQLGPPPKKTVGQRRPKSFLIPIIDLLSSFPAV